MSDLLLVADSLDVLREMGDAGVDLIYLDPPFNSSSWIGGRRVAGTAMDRDRQEPPRHRDRERETVSRSFPVRRVCR